MITGVIKSIPSKDGKPASYAFIKGDDGKEYFLHISEFKDQWDRLEATIAMKTFAKVEFESASTSKGLRAVNCRLI